MELVGSSWCPLLSPLFLALGGGGGGGGLMLLDVELTTTVGGATDALLLLPALLLLLLPPPPALLPLVSAWPWALLCWLLPGPLRCICCVDISTVSPRGCCCCWAWACGGGGRGHQPCNTRMALRTSACSSAARSRTVWATLDDLVYPPKAGIIWFAWCLKFNRVRVDDSGATMKLELFSMTGWPMGLVKTSSSRRSSLMVLMTSRTCFDAAHFVLLSLFVSVRYNSIISICRESHTHTCTFRTTVTHSACVYTRSRFVLFVALIKQHQQQQRQRCCYDHYVILLLGYSTLCIYCGSSWHATGVTHTRTHTCAYIYIYTYSDDVDEQLNMYERMHVREVVDQTFVVVRGIYELLIVEFCI